MVVLNLPVLTCAYANLDMIITFSCSTTAHLLLYMFHYQSHDAQGGVAYLVMALNRPHMQALCLKMKA